MLRHAGARCRSHRGGPSSCGADLGCVTRHRMRRESYQIQDSLSIDNLYIDYLSMMSLRSRYRGAESAAARAGGMDQTRSTGNSPTIRKRALARKLVEYRQRRGLTTTDVQRRLSWSATKLNWIEKARWTE